MTRVNGLMAKCGRSSGRPFSLMTVYFDAEDDCFKMDRPISNKRLLY